MNKQKIVKIINDNYTQIQDQFGVEKIDIRSVDSECKEVSFIVQLKNSNLEQFTAVRTFLQILFENDGYKIVFFS